MIHLVLAILAIAAFAAFCLSVDRHRRALWDAVPAGWSRRLHLAGWVLCLLGFALAGLALGWGYGTVEWFGMMSLGAAAAVLALNLSPDRNRARKR